MGIGGNWDRRVSRRAFLGLGGMGAAALMFGAKGMAEPTDDIVGYGPLVRDPGGIVDLPKGFQYRIISAEGSQLTGGGTVPGDHDGMAAFQGTQEGTTVLVRNHELIPSEGPAVEGTNPYDPTQPGGTVGIVVDNRTRRKVRDFVTSSGTQNNCAGGATPWGTWLTCEESFQPGHGYVFEVDPRNPRNNLSKTPIRDMGFFSHEATATDPRTGIVYLTEDDPGGNLNGEDTDVGTSFIFRYIPNDRRLRPGALQRGGRLQAMALEEGPFAGPGPDADTFDPRQRFRVRWIDVNPEAPRPEALARGAVKFNRLEGAFFRGGAFWFDDTNGGENRLGQLFRYYPNLETLELWYEGTDSNKMESPDNIVVTPFGDLWFAEDEAVEGNSVDRVMGATPDGRVYTFARNRLNDSEFAGPTFAPDGRTFFVNIQDPGMTLAIWGPFQPRSLNRQAAMANAAPPEDFAPLVFGELAEAADKYGMSTLEAAAYDRLGVQLTA